MENRNRSQLLHRLSLLATIIWGIYSFVFGGVPVLSGQDGFAKKLGVDITPTIQWWIFGGLTVTVLVLWIADWWLARDKKYMPKRLLSAPFLFEAGRTLKMKISSTGPDHLNGCKVKIIEIENEKGERVAQPDRVLYVSGEAKDCSFILYSGLSHEFTVIENFLTRHDPQDKGFRFRPTMCGAAGDSLPLKRREHKITVQAFWDGGYSEPVTFRFSVGMLEMKLLD